MNTQDIQNFITFVSSLKGEEKDEAQIFCDRLFKAYEHPGFIEVGGLFEAQVKTFHRHHQDFSPIFPDSDFKSEDFSGSFPKETHGAGIKGSRAILNGLWSPAGHSGVLIEMKNRSEKDLEKHFPQARNFWCAMNPEKILGPGFQKPKYIVLCNFDKFIIYDNLLKVDELFISELSTRWTALNFLLPNEREPIFECNTREISEQAARNIGELFKHLVFDLHYDRETAQRFVLQSVVALFSEDLELLPKGLFLELIQLCRLHPEESFELIGGLFRQMSSKTTSPTGRFKGIRYFNGGLFEKVDPIELDAACLDYLEKSSRQNWRHVNPAIFGGLFESTMSKESRHEYGAHFTHSEDIYKIIYPVIIRPWTQKIEEANTLTKLSKVWNELAAFRVLDPACGCGNFLFMAFQAVKDLELEIIEKISTTYSLKSAQKQNLGLSRISTKQFFGLDILPMAVELAKVTMMIAKETASKQWNEKVHTFAGLSFDFDESLPLDNLNENILCQDAVLEPWPEFDCVIGNPPYQSKNKMTREMDKSYISKIRERFPDVPGRADFCVYWFRKTHELLKPGQRAGLVGTNTIRQNYSREGGLDFIVENGGTITDAVSSQKWAGDAIVYVSVVNWIKGQDESEKTLSLQNGDHLNSPYEYRHPEIINSSLSFDIDVSGARPLKINAKSDCCFQGQTQGHSGFLLKKDEALEILKKHPNYADVLFPYLTGDEMLSQKDSLPTRYVIDFRHCDCSTASRYTELFTIIEKTVFQDIKERAENEIAGNKELLQKNPKAHVNRSHANNFKTWWQLFASRKTLMNILQTVSRYIVCSRVTKRPIFEFISSSIHPNDALQVFPMEDNYSFGILQSTAHFEWFSSRCSTLKGDPRYTSNTVFDTFPWPQNLTVQQIESIAQYARELVIKRREIMLENDFCLRDLYRMMEKTANNPISDIQNQLDSAVCNAYGMRKNENCLEFLLEQNKRLYQQEQDKQIVRGPGFPLDIIADITPFITEESVKF